MQLSKSSWAQAPAIPRSTTPSPAVSFAHGQRDRAAQHLPTQDRLGPFPRRASHAETSVSGDAFPLLHPGTVGSRASAEPWSKAIKDIPLDSCAARSVDHAFELENAANHLHRVLKHQPGSDRRCRPSPLPSRCNGEPDSARNASCRSERGAPMPTPHRTRPISTPSYLSP